MKILIQCPHCGGTIDITEYTSSNRPVSLNDAAVEYDPVHEAVINHFRQDASELSYVFPAAEQLNKTCCYAGKTVCYTGFTDADKAVLREISDELGMAVKTSISRRVELLVCGPNAGPAKIRKCEELSIPVVDIEDFLTTITAEG